MKTSLFTLLCMFSLITSAMANDEDNTVYLKLKKNISQIPEGSAPEYGLSSILLGVLTPKEGFVSKYINQGKTTKYFYYSMIFENNDNALPLCKLDVTVGDKAKYEVYRDEIYTNFSLKSFVYDSEINKHIYTIDFRSPENTIDYLNPLANKSGLEDAVLICNEELNQESVKGILGKLFSVGLTDIHKKFIKADERVEQAKKFGKKVGGQLNKLKDRYFDN